MVFEDETSAILSISDYVTEAANGLFLATKYIFALSANDFYSCDIRDVLRVILNNLRKPEMLSVFRLKISDECCAAMNTKEYDFVRELILYSFAVRLPVFQTVCGIDGLSDNQVNSAYDTILLNIDRGVSAYVRGSLEETRRRVKKHKPVAPYRADWFIAYIYDRCGELTAINNRSLFFMGAVDPLFSMFNLRLEQELSQHILSLAVLP